MPAPTLLPPSVAASAREPQLCDDMLHGIDEIAKALGLDRLGQDRARRAIYEMRRRGRVPIFHLDGVGLVARRSALRAYIERQEAEALDRKRGQR